MIIKKNYDLKKLNSFGLSVLADNFTEVGSVDDFILLLKTKFKPLHILGGGSNVLMTDHLEGLVVKNNIGGIEIIEEKNDHAIVAAGGGVVWHDLVLWALDHDLGGIENLSLIPGSVGAAPIQNIGAYGVELKDIFYKLEALDLGTGEIHVFDENDCVFGYRDSIFKNIAKGKYFISRVYLKLPKRHLLNTSYGAIQNKLIEKNINKPGIRDISNVVIEIRKSKLPDPEEIGNAGSFFKNPIIDQAHFNKLQSRFPEIVYYEMPDKEIKIAAGWLIEKAGWKGKRIGDAGCHAKQALVLVNYGQAKGTEIMDLAFKIQTSVKDLFDVQLTPEVNLW